MDTYRVRASGTVEAENGLVHRIIADYRDGHPNILPKRYFSPLTIEEGEFGAGTKLRFSMKALGRTQSFHVRITEAEPGKILVETDADSGAVTTFRIVPTNSASGSHVTIETELMLRRGLSGRIEMIFVRRFLEMVYAEELRLLAELARKWKSVSTVLN